ncbi:MAG TPA: S41 family peptidase [Bacillota bacterium]|nr:S41 family peptidase [Bacillota bacterium]
MSRVKRISLALVAVSIIAALTLSTVRANDYFDAIRQVFEIVQSDYYREVDPMTLIKGALSGIMQAVNDPHSSYMPPVAFDDYWERATGEYVGIGIVFEASENGLKVLEVFGNTPASRADIRSGDILLYVDGTPLRGLDATEIRQLFGDEDREFEIVVQRSEENITVKVKAERIISPSAQWRMLDGGIAYIKILQFGSNLEENLQEAFGEMADHTAVILDLRGCPGGLLDSAVAVSGHFVPAGPFIRLMSRGGQEEVITSAGPGPDNPLVVLTNGLTASAAEILAGAIQDHRSGTLIGSKTYGKGVAQNVYQLNEELGGIRITSMKFLTPLGRDYDGTGLEPDIWADAISIRYEKQLAPLVPDSRTLRQGLSGSDVSLLQNALRALGHFNHSSTGYYGNITAAAVRAFQQKAGLPLTGVADNTTIHIMNSFHLRTPIYGDGIMAKALEVLASPRP